jgi:hypothetical protein
MKTISTNALRNRLDKYRIDGIVDPSDFHVHFTNFVACVRRVIDGTIVEKYTRAGADLWNVEAYPS